MYLIWNHVQGLKIHRLLYKENILVNSNENLETNVLLISYENVFITIVKIDSINNTFKI